MRALLWTIAVLVAVLGFAGVVTWLHHGSHGPQLGTFLRLAPWRLGTIDDSPEVSNFRVGERVFHNTFGHGTIVATDGHKLTIHFDDGGVKRVIDDFVVSE